MEDKSWKLRMKMEFKPQLAQGLTLDLPVLDFHVTKLKGM